MHLSEISVKKPVAIGMFFIGMILLGLVSLSRLSVDLLPDLAYPKLTIWTTYRDVGPQAMEEFITRPVEEVLTTVPGERSYPIKSCKFKNFPQDLWPTTQIKFTQNKIYLYQNKIQLMDWKRA